MNIVYNALVYVVWFLSTYVVVLLMLILLAERKKLFEKRNSLGRTPKVTIIVPAFNEEHKIAKTIKSLKNVTYNNYNVIVVNDGSKDKTSEVVKKAIEKDARFRFIDREENKGKAFSLNEGIMESDAEFVACMDADSSIEEGIFQKVFPYFEENEVGAVTVSVEVKNPKTFLHKIIDIEYIIGLSMFLKVFSTFNCVFVTPGPFSVYRRKMLLDIGLFDTKNMTEDLEIAYRIHKAGFRIENCLDARVQTICPESFKGIYVQRRRWYAGALQTLTKHKDIMFSRKLGAFGLFIPVNYLLIGAGMSVFYASTYLLISRIVKTAWYFNYTDLNILGRIAEIDLDMLALSQLTLIGYMAVLLTVSLMMLGMYLTRKEYRTRKVGMLGFPFMFFLYQIFWTGAIVAFLRKGGKVKWR